MKTLFAVLMLLFFVACGKDNITQPKNNPPVINSLTASPQSVPVSNTATVSCSATDTDGDPLSYFWSVAGGVITNDNNSSITWQAPNSQGSYSVTCKVDDGKGGTDTKSINITVTQSASNLIDELNYQNNLAYFSIHIGTPTINGPDLSVEGVSSPQHHVGSPSGSWQITYRIINIGQSSISQQSVAKIYLSDDKYFNDGDILIGTSDIPSLAVGNYSEQNTLVGIPSGQSLDQCKYIVIVADAYNSVNELNENNNYNSFSLHLGTPSQNKADLTVEGLYSPQHHVGSPSGNWDINFRVLNMGQGAVAPPVNVKIYFSGDTELSGDDYFITESRTNNISVGSYQFFIQSIGTPAGYSNGYYYILVKTNTN